MKTIRFLITVLSISLLCVSCEKEIDVTLNNSKSLPVVQANIYPGNGPFYVYLSKSSEFKNTNVYPAIEHALVIISDNHGRTDTLTEDSAGRYVTHSIVGVVGYTYQLKISTENMLYSARSTMYPPVGIDSVKIKDSDFGDGHSIDLYYTDPLTDTNYYRYREYVNGNPKTDFYVDNDKTSNGKATHYSILTAYQDDDTDLQPGDKVKIQLQSIDKGVYDYFRTAGGLNSMSASPANPMSNISNGALGYFNACSFSEFTVTF